MQNRVVTTLLIASLALAACAGGGTGGTVGMLNPAMTNSSPTPPIASGTGSNSGPQTIVYCCTDTLVSGAVATPIPGSWGANPIAPQLANGTSSFAGPIVATFPLLSSGLQAAPGGLVPVPPGQGATITFPSATPQGAVSWQLIIPAANVNDSGWESVPLLINSDSPIQELNYVGYGEWIKRSDTSNPGSVLQSDEHFVFGYETLGASMPKAGAANFAGFFEGSAFQPMSGQTIHFVDLWGNASFSVDFASGKITGAFTGISYNDPTNMIQPWNDVSVSAAIAAGTNRFGGMTAVTSSPANSFSLKPSAAGSVNGAFFGPAAQQLGAVWTLSDGTISALGSVTAAH